MSEHHLRDLIPGGAHTYTKGDDQFPSNAPEMIERGEGAYVFDPDENRYLDLTMGLTSVILGHAYEPVLDAVRRELTRGVNFQRPASVELEFAETLHDLFPWFDQFKFAKNGSTVTTAAVKLARAYTGRDRVALCGDHDFFSYDDWFIGTTVMDRGVPDATRELSLTFPYGDLDAVERLFTEYEDEIACLILEPVMHDGSATGEYLSDLKTLCHRHGAILILDEIITGFKWDLQGAQSRYDVEPDLATFGKSIANGFSVDVLAGRDDLMKLGGLDHDEERVFLVSTTNGAETHGLRAAIATIGALREHDVIEHRKRLGRRIKEELNDLFRARDLHPYLEVVGFPALPILKARGPNETLSNPFRTLLCQELLRENILFQGMITLSYAHGSDEVEHTLEGFERAADTYAKALDRGSAEPFLDGPPMKPVFRKYN